MFEKYKLTDQGNAERFSKQYSNVAKYNHSEGKWMLWNGKKWAIDEENQVHKLAVVSIKSIYDEVKEVELLDEAQKISKWASASLSEYRIRSMLKLSEPLTTIRQEELDISEWLLNLQNGTMNLKDGEFQDHDPLNRISKISPVTYNPNAECPQWLSFLDRIMDGDTEMVKYLQKCIGYSLTGSTREQCMFILFGNGANGKSTFINTILHILGEYASQTPIETLTPRRSEGARSDIARLCGQRFVSTSEAENQQAFAEALVKQLTGGDTITARFMYKEYFEFVPSFKVFLATNHKPKIKGTDLGIWRRLRPIPFSVTIPQEERDPELERKLKSEASGILNWAIEGCTLWLQDGLLSPRTVEGALLAYQSEMDVITNFITDRCVLAQGERTQKICLYEEYVSFCKDSDLEPMSSIKFGRSLRNRGVSSKRFSDADYWLDIEIKPSNEHVSIPKM